MQPPTLTLVVNPTAGRGKAVRVHPSVVQELLKGAPSARLNVVRATSYEEARIRCIAAVEAARTTPVDGRHDCLVVMGGDGMMHLGLNAAAGSGVPLGVIPAGTGNDFCRGVGLPTKLEAAIAVIADGHTREVDLMSVDGELVDGTQRRWVGSILSTGFDEKVNWRANHLPVSFGAPSYAYPVIAELRTFRPLRYRLLVDGVPRELDAILVAVGNAGVFGGGIRICPEASVTDGRLDVTMVHPVPRSLIFRLFRQLFTGEFAKHPSIETLTAEEVVVDGDDLFGMADGEDLGRPPFTCRAVGAAARLYVPQ